jgi:predicted Rossmann-fold nucleotide-binding protein
LEGYHPENPLSYAETLDFQIFRYFVITGRSTPTDALASIMEALHDNSITQGVLSFLLRQERVVAVMGGHDEERGSPSYRSVLKISRKLALQGFLLASGGGPGAMEATHLGALLKASSDEEVDRAISALAVVKGLPPSSKVIGPDGDIDESIVRLLHAWLLPAYEILCTVNSPGKSLGVPTWYYGHEPFTPLATHVAKYFQNSIREDGLLALAAHGIVFAPGKAGTLQEIFQDAAQNYYHSVADRFSPMVFFGLDYWTKALPIRVVLESLFKQNGREEEYQRLVLFTDDADEAVQFLVDRALSKRQLTERWKAVGLEAALERLEAEQRPPK